MLLRDYTPVDQDAVFELNTHAADPRWRIDPESPTYADLRDIPQAYQREGAFLVGEAAGAIVAMGGVRNIDEGIFELKRIRVDSAHRRRGYAPCLSLGWKPAPALWTASRSFSIRLTNKNRRSAFTSGLATPSRTHRSWKAVSDPSISCTTARSWFDLILEGPQ